MVSKDRNMACTDIISNSDILLIYKKYFVENIIVNYDNCVPNTIKKLSLNLYTKENKPILLRPLEIYYHKNKQYISFKGIGKVVEIVYVSLNHTYRNKGYYKQVHLKELSTYKKYNFKEIQLNAIYQGIIVWKKLGFNYVYIDDDKKMLATWIDFMLNDKLDIPFSRKVVIINKYKLLSDVEEEYLKGFYDWLIKNYREIMIPMYKKV